MNPHMDPRRARCFLVVIDPGWGKSKMEHLFYSYRDALEACAEDQQKRPNPAKYHLIWGPDEATVNASYADLMRGGTIRTESMEQDLTRYSKEHGPGGDHDKPFEYELPQSVSVQVAWARLAGAVQRGQIGGENDGEEDATGSGGEAA